MHIRVAELRQHKVIAVAGRRMDGALRVGQGFEMLDQSTEQSMRLGHPQPPIHHGGGID